jgi:hypothetical protein
MKNFIFIAFVGFLVWLYFYLSIANYHPTYVSPPQQILEIPPEKTPVNNEIQDLCNHINQKNDQIQAFLCKNVAVRFNNHNVSGTLAFEKPGRFRFIVNSFFGKELDIGSNDTYFWMWSKETNTLRYVRHEQIHQAKLKTPMHPDWLIEGINFRNISKNIEYANSTFFETRQSPNGEIVRCLTKIDATKKIMTGHFLYNMTNQLIASSEIVSFQKIDELNIPKTIVINWPQEKMRFEWTFVNSKINIQIAKSQWVMPNYKNMVNMAK